LSYHFAAPFFLSFFSLGGGDGEKPDASATGKAFTLPYRLGAQVFPAGVETRSISSYFLIGALFSLVKAPCVGGVYLAILDRISAGSYLDGAT